MNQEKKQFPITQNLHHSRVFFLAITDAAGNLFYVNDWTRRFFNLPQAIDTVSFSAIVADKDKDHYATSFARCKKNPQQHVQVVLGHLPETGKGIKWEIYAELDPNNQIKGIIHLGHEAASKGDQSAINNWTKDFPFGMGNEKIRTVVNHIPGAIYRCRGDEAITLEFFSDEVVKLTGYPLSYFLNNRESGYSTLVYEEDREIFQATIRKAISEQDKYELEYRIKNINGEVIWLFESGQANMDTTDGIVYIDGCIFDISRRKKMEMALAKSEAEVKRLALVAENTTNSVMITDADGQIVWINDGYTRISGYTLEEIKGKKIGYSLEGEKADPEAKKRITQYLKNLTPYKEELLSINKEGEPIWLEVDCQPMFDDQGKHLGFMSIESDITLKKASQKAQEDLLQRLSLATDSAEIGIFEIDLNTNEVIWDDKMYEIYGYQKDQSLNLYKTYFKAIHPDDAARMAEIIAELLSSRKEINGAIYRIILPNNSVRYIESHAIIKKSESGRVLSLIGTNRDITEDILGQEKIKSQNKVLREIAFIQSHEVRRPLANILGIIEILQNSGTLKGLEIFDHLVESAQDLDKQIRAIVNKANEMDDEVFR